MSKAKKPIATVDGNIVTVEGVQYRFCRHIGDQIDEIVPTIRRDGKEWHAPLVCDMKLDAGGCGKDAAKVHIGVPICYFLQNGQRVEQ